MKNLKISKIYKFNKQKLYKMRIKVTFVRIFYVYSPKNKKITKKAFKI